MSDTILGVVIGGVIGLCAPIAVLIAENIKWKQNRRIDYYKEKRVWLEESFEKSTKLLRDGMAKNSYDTDMVFTVMHRFPQEVYDEFDKLMMDRDKSEEKKRDHYFKIVSKMKKVLADLDSRIESEMN